MKLLARDRVELGAKILAIVGGLFAIWQYFADASDAKELEKRRQALTYVQAYGATDLSEHRRIMFEFWLRHSDLLQVAKSQGVSESAYRAFFFTALEHDAGGKPMLNALYALSNFYDQLAFCRSSKVCDREIIDQYFCAGARTFGETYGPISGRLAELSGVSDFGRGAKEIAESCEPPSRAS